MSDIQVLGIEKAVEAFNKRLSNVRSYTNKAMADVLFDLLGESVKLAPLDLGPLRGSAAAKINGTVVATGNQNGTASRSGLPTTSDRMSGEVSYSEVYAMRQHEAMNYTHVDGEAKFLEKPFNKNSTKYITYLANSVRKAVD